MTKKKTPASAEPVEDVIVPAKKPSTRKTKADEPVKVAATKAVAAVKAPKAVAPAETAPEPKVAPKATKTRAPRKKKTEEPVAEPEAEEISAEVAEEVDADQDHLTLKGDDPEVAEDDEDEEDGDEDEDFDDLDDEDEEEIGDEDDEDEDEEEEDGEEGEARADRPAAKLERLQKILSKAGISSRRHAEELIEAGRVQVNGEVITTLGVKADIDRDHIRVDGKLLQGIERHRYFMLNKPKGYVTTVSDPEGRPTVMQFFDKAGERLYPVGRLDYLSEGLLLVTNDGDLANLLTKAGSGVEKTYLVKVSGQPSEEELAELRAGIAIERAEPGSERVRTAPARVRQVRDGENPWFEVVLIEGRNRELRKMFVAIGHFVEKIRRVAYGPLILDVEPGKFRELESSEIEALRLTAEGKIKPSRIKTTRLLPKEAGRAVDHDGGKYGKRPFRPGGRGPSKFGSRPDSRGGSSFRPSGDRPARSGPPSGSSFRPAGDRPRPAGSFDRGASSDRPARPQFDRGAGSDRPRPSGPRPSGPRYDGAGSSDRPPRPQFDRGAGGGNGGGGSYGDRPRAPRPQFDRGGGSDRPRPSGPRPSGPRYDGAGSSDRPPRPQFDRGAGGGSYGDRPRAPRPQFDRGGGSDRPRPSGPRPSGPRYDGAGSSDRPPRPQFDRGGDRGNGGGSYGDRPRAPRPQFDRGGGSDRPRPSGPRSSGPRYDGGGSSDRPRPSFDRNGGGDRPTFRPRPAGDGDRPRAPRPDGDRPRPSYGGSNSRPSTGPSAGRKPNFGGPKKSFGPRPGGFKPRTGGGGGRPSGGRPGGRPSGGGGKRY